jgi:glycosyltransferase involved in cell wall biosynthesis
VTPSRDPIRVFVHLSHGVDAEVWRAGWADGSLIGVNEPSPYGYDRAEALGCSVTYSVPARENAVSRLIRLGVRAITGFDLVHAWRNRRGIREAEVVWTHTESQGLAVAALLVFRRRPRRPALLLQNVWLIDRWARYPPPHRWLFSRLLRTADVLTFHSVQNRETAERLLSPARCELVRFGIRIDEMTPPVQRHGGARMSVLSLGNDEHRDWATAVRAIELIPSADLTVLSQSFPAALARSRSVTVHRARSNDELAALFAAADLVMIALSPNQHASGLTVLQEAVIQGVPVVVTATGGLTDYFDETMVTFVPPGNAEAMAEGLRNVVADGDRSHAMATRAQSRMSPDQISSVAFVRSHVDLSRELLGRVA